MIGRALPAVSGLLAVFWGMAGCLGDGDSPFPPSRPAVPFFVTDSSPQNLSEGVPTTVVIDRTGTVVGYFTGVHEERELRAALKKAGL